MVVVKGLDRHLPDKLRERVLMVYTDGKITPIIIASEFRSRHFPLLEGTGFWCRFLEVRFFLESAGGLASDALRAGVFGEGSREGEFMDGFVEGVFEFVLGDVFLGEVSEGRVRVLRCILVLPWLVGLIVLLAEDAPQLVFA